MSTRLADVKPISFGRWCGNRVTIRKDIRAATTCVMTKIERSTTRPIKFVTIQPFCRTKPTAIPKDCRISQLMQSKTK